MPRKGGMPQNLTTPKKGEVRNPFGAPKLKDRIWKPLSDDLKTALGDMVDIETKMMNGEIVVSRRTFREQITRKLVVQASQGNLKATEMLFDRLEGKPRQAIEHSSDQENPPEFVVRVIKPD